MKAIICVEDNGGICFHSRRVSQDVHQREDVCARYGKEGLLMKASTAELYKTQESVSCTIVPSWAHACSLSGWCVFEDREVSAYEKELEEVVIYRWNRRYPSDEKLRLTLKAPLWRCVKRYEFAGKSHPRISVEHYRKESGKKERESK